MPCCVIGFFLFFFKNYSSALEGNYRLNVKRYCFRWRFLIPFSLKCRCIALEVHKTTEMKFYAAQQAEKKMFEMNACLRHSSVTFAQWGIAVYGERASERSRQHSII